MIVGELRSSVERDDGTRFDNNFRNVDAKDVDGVQRLSIAFDVPDQRPVSFYSSYEATLNEGVAGVVDSDVPEGTVDSV